MDLRISAMFLSFWGCLIRMQTLTGFGLSLEQQAVHCLQSHKSVWKHLCVSMWCVWACASCPLGRAQVCRVFLWSVSGGVTCPLQDALISFAQAEPGDLPGAQWTVPKWHGGEPVLAEHEALLINSTRTHKQELRFELKGSLWFFVFSLAKHVYTVNMMHQQNWCKKLKHTLNSSFPFTFKFRAMKKS